MTQEEKQQLLLKLSIPDVRKDVIRQLMSDAPYFETIEELFHEVATNNLSILSNCYGGINHILVTLPGGQSGNSAIDKAIENQHVKRLEMLFDALEQSAGQMKVTLFTEAEQTLHISTNELWERWKDKYISLNLERPAEVEIPDLTNMAEKVFNDILLLDNVVSNRSLSSPAYLPEDIEDLVKFALGGDLSMWAQDPFVVLTSQDKGILLLEPNEISSKRATMSLIANRLQLFYGADLPISLVEQVGWQLDGGNILAGDNYVLIGADHYRKPFGNRTKVAKALGVSSAKKVYIIESGNIADSLPFMTGDQVAQDFKVASLGVKQPLFHLDLFLTIVGRETDNTNAPERIMVGYPVAIFEESLPLIKAVRKEIENVVIQLKQWGFKVLRNPMPLVYKEDASGRKRWYFAYYNNCIVEVTKTVKTVWLPSYGQGRFAEHCAKYDTAMEWIWRNLGFQPIWAGDYSEFADDHGSLHCTIKCLGRNHYY